MIDSAAEVRIGTATEVGAETATEDRAETTTEVGIGIAAERLLESRVFSELSRASQLMTR